MEESNHSSARFSMARITLLSVCGFLVVAFFVVFPRVDSLDSRPVPPDYIILRDVSLALHNYFGKNDSRWPDRVTVDNSGQLLHSWRVEVSPPFFASDEIDRQSPWSTENNLKRFQTMKNHFAVDEEIERPSECRVFALADSTGRTFFERWNEADANGNPLPDMSDTLVLIYTEIPGERVEWYEPIDVTYANRVPEVEHGRLISLADVPGDGFVVGWLDGSRFYMKREEFIRRMTDVEHFFDGEESEFQPPINMEF